MRILKRLKKSINTILLFIRAFEIACLVVKHNKEKIPSEKKRKPEGSIMGGSKTVLANSVVELEHPIGRYQAKEDEINYEQESIQLETSDISFESLEELDGVITGKTEVTQESKDTLKKLEGTELGIEIKSRISSLLDRVDFSTEEPQSNLVDLSALLD